MRIAYFESFGGVHYHRLKIPFDYISSEHEVSEVNYVPVGETLYDVVVFNRIPNNLYPYGAIKKLKEQGVKIVYDIDDYWTRPPYNFNFDERYEGQYTIEILKYLRLADVVWCSTKGLVQLCAPFNDNVHHIPNALDYQEPMWNRVYKGGRETLRYGWIGGLGHQMDFNVWRPHFDERYKAEVMLGGYTDENKPYWDYLGKVLSGAQLHKVKMFRKLDVDKYGYLYNELDIVTLPTFNDVFSSCKSNLKLLEAGAHKLPVITNGGYYKEVNGKIGLRVQSPAQVKKAMNDLIRSERLRTELGDALHEYTTKKYNLHEINKLRIQTLQ